MSRTYRRTKEPVGSHRGFYYARTCVTRRHLWYVVNEYTYMGEWFEEYPTEMEMQKARAYYYRDRTVNKEPGPRWFRNQFETRPSRQKNKRELHKYLRFEEYEPMCFTKAQLPYWT